MNEHEAEGTSQQPPTNPAGASPEPGHQSRPGPGYNAPAQPGHTDPTWPGHQPAQPYQTPPSQPDPTWPGYQSSQPQQTPPSQPDPTWPGHRATPAPPPQPSPSWPGYQPAQPNPTGHGAGGWMPAAAPGQGGPGGAAPPLGPSGPSGGGHSGGWSPQPPYGAGGWATPATTHAHRTNKGALAGIVAGAVAVAAVAGVVIGHAAWNPSSSSPSASQSPLAPGNGSGGGSGSIPGGGSGNSGPGAFGPNGNSGSGSSGSNSSGPADADSIAKNVDPGLVDINTNLSYQQAQAAGTGMVLTSNGEVLTNNHVINGATKISVTDVGNGKTYDASVVGYDRSHDVAVLQLSGASGLQTVKPGNSANLSVGQGVVGIGNAGGSGGTPSYAGGTITALNQSITASDEGDSTSEKLTGLIQTNADIQPGDSGGPLVNTSGEVIGMDTAASSGFQFSSPQSSNSQGFAIPINDALSVAKQITSGNASSTVHIGPTAFLGVEVSSSSSNSSGGGGGGFGGLGGLGNGFGNGNGSSNGGGSSTSGAVIQSVPANTPAANAGLTGGDTITAVDGKTISTPSDLTKIMLQEKPNNTVSVTYTDSSGQSHTVQVQLGSGPPQ